MLFRILLVLFISLSLNANDKYYITYNDITLGEVTNLETIYDGYVLAVPTSAWVKFILDFDKYIIYEPNKKPKISGKTRYNKDKYFIIKMINELKKYRPGYKVFKEREQVLTLKCRSNKCNYVRKNTKNNDTYNGYINFTSDNKLKIICDDESSICIEKIN